MTKKERLKRDEEIKNLFHHTDLTYTEIGKVYGVTKQCINQIAKRMGISRWEESRKRNEVILDLRKKRKQKLHERNQLIVKEYRTKTAKQLIEDNGYELKPQTIYHINSNSTKFRKIPR